MDNASTTAVDAPPLIIPIFIPQLGCPHQCVFCRQETITGTKGRLPSKDHIRQEVRRFLHFGKRRSSLTQIAFFGGNFLGLKRSSVRALLETARDLVQTGTVDSIRFSTRPDTVSEDRMDFLAAFPVSTVELGVQSMDDRVLHLAGRGHQAADTVAAARLLKKQGYQLGLQMMVGLPENSDDGAMETARRLAALQPDFVRIYPTLVLEGSLLADWVRSSRYRPMPLDHCVQLVKRLYLYFKANHISVIRMGLQASDGLDDSGNLLAGPYHPAFGHLVHAAIAFDAIASAIEKMTAPPKPLIITTHPRMISRVQGLNKHNLSRLQQRFNLDQIILIQNEALATDRLLVSGEPVALP